MPVVGEQVAFQASTLFQNRDLPVLNEYRSVFGGLLGRQFGLNASQLAQVFPGATPRACARLCLRNSASPSQTYRSGRSDPLTSAVCQAPAAATSCPAWAYTAPR